MRRMWADKHYPIRDFQGISSYPPIAFTVFARVVGYWAKHYCFSWSGGSFDKSQADRNCPEGRLVVKDIHRPVRFDVNRLPAEYRLKVFNGLHAFVEIKVAN